MLDRFKRLMDERRGTDAYPIFVGAVAVSKSWTLVARDHSFIAAMKEVKENPDAVPERFRNRVGHFDIKKGHLFDVSDAADLVFSLLQTYEDKVAWVDYWGSMGPSRGNGHLGNQYIMDNEDAAKYIAEEGFTSEELDWLWEIAQAMHVLPDKPVERR